MPNAAGSRRPRVTMETLIDAAVVVTAAQGSRGLTVASVARELQTSIRPVHSRVAGRSELLATLWEQRLWPVVDDLLSRALRASQEDPGPWLSALDLARTPEDERAAAVELLLHARFDPVLDQAVAATAAVRVSELTTPSEHLSEQFAARNAFVLALTLGLLIGARHRRARSLDLPAAMPVWSKALSPVPTDPLPRRNAAFIDEYPVLAEDDPALDILLNTTLDLVSRFGFDQVSTAQIAKEAGFTEGLVFSRYRSKLDMVLDATRRQNEAGIALNHAFTTALRTDYNPAIAEAVLAREAQLPQRGLGRSMALEQIRLGWHHQNLAAEQQQAMDDFRAQLLSQPRWASYETDTDFFLQFALSWGLYLLPLLNPAVHELPYAAVLVPLYEAFDQRCPGVAPMTRKS